MLLYGGTLTTSTRTITISGTFTVGSGTSGTLNINSATGAKNFYGLVTINSGATWNNTANEAVTLRGGIANNGTFNAGTGVYTFDTNAQAISGTISIPSVTVNGITLTNSGNLTVGATLTGATGTLTNNGTLAIGGTCSIGTTSGGINNTGTIDRTGSGSTTTPLTRFNNTGIINLGGSGSITGITNNANGVVNHDGSSTITRFNNATSTSTLNIGTTPLVPTFTNNITCAVGSTVNYDGAGNQTIKAQTYSNLVLSGSGTKTIGTATDGTLTSGNLSIAPTGNAIASVTNTNITVNSLTLGGNGAVNGSWGSTFSVATNQDNSYFAATTGYLNVSSNTCSPPAAPTTTGAEICIGSTATLSASGATSGQKYRWYSASTGGAPLKTSTDNADNTYTTPTISATTNYWVSILSSGRCESARTQATANFPVVSADDRNRAGTDTWIGHVFKRLDSSPGSPSDANAFTNYYGTITSNETFNESFVGTNSCLPLTATESARSIYTEYFAARFRMNSLKTGVYLADIGSDDGIRLTVDGTLICNQWVERGYLVDALVLFSLTGTSNILLEYYESTGGNQVSFQNLVKVPNNLTSGTNQIICATVSLSQISGNNSLTETPISGTSGFTVSYQWQQATNSIGPWSDISGATSQNYTPSGLTAGTYYFRRKLTVSRTNPGTIAVSATDFSGFATVTVNDNPIIAAISAPAALCAGGSLNQTAPTVTANGSTVTAQGWQLETAVGGGTFSNLTVPYTVTYADNGKKIRYYATNGCGSTNSNEVILAVNPLPTATISSNNSPVCSGSDAHFTLTGTNSATVTYSLDGGTITNTVVLNGGTASVIVTGATTNQTLILESVTNGTCSQSLSGSSTVTVNPLPATGEIIPD